ncbi:MAG: hypothetical protein K6F62_03845 [Schwartzia sp.]|nr:hypothetical protein [Schwartzia sp. (in: firmicutes)]
MKRIFLLMLCMMLFAVPAMANEKPAGLVPEDFGSRGILLGETVTEEQMTKAFGAPLFDNDRSVFGIHVRYYQFKKNIQIGVLMKDNTVCDIIIKDEDYIGRDGVRYGATPYKIEHTYGKCSRTLIEGHTWYIYNNPNAPRQKLMIEMLAGVYTLQTWRITSLPVTLEEAESYDEDSWENRDLHAFEMNTQGIDTTAIEARDRAEAETSKDRWKKGAGR